MNAAMYIILVAKLLRRHYGEKSEKKYVAEASKSIRHVSTVKRQSLERPHHTVNRIAEQHNLTMVSDPPHGLLRRNLTMTDELEEMAEYAGVIQVRPGAEFSCSKCGSKTKHHDLMYGSYGSRIHQHQHHVCQNIACATEFVVRIINPDDLNLLDLLMTSDSSHAWF